MTLDTRPAVAGAFTELESSGAVSPAVSFLRRLVTEGSDFDCYKINAFRVAESLGISRLEAVRAFLFATRLGITDLTWDIHCPSCRGVPEYHRHLMQLRRTAHCPLCELRWDVSLEEQVEVTFTVNENVRRLPIESVHETGWPASAEIYQMRLVRDGRLPEMAGPIVPGVPALVTGVLVAGEYECSTPGHPEGACPVHVEGAVTEEPQLVSVRVESDGSISPRALTLRPGPARFEVESAYPKPWGFGVIPRGCQPRHWLSAAYVTGLQDFRDLFSGEFLAPDLSFGVRSTTLLFTDIKGSTEMYERLGDAQAFALVRQHFELMTDVIRRHEGCVVKTIGDAVMASFSVNREAVAAALEIQTGFAEVSPPLRSIEVKLGLHRGPTITVTSNDRLDFFGRTVNIAARVQGASAPGEVLMSEAVASDPAVVELLAERGLSPTVRERELKGIPGRARLHAVLVRPTGAA